MSDDYERPRFADLVARWGIRFLNTVSVFLFFGLVYLYLSRGLIAPDDSWNWMDFIVILLGIVTVMLAALGTMIAIAAIWGYQQIREGAAAISKAAVERHLKSREFDRKLESTIEERIENAYIEKAVEISLGEEKAAPVDGEESDWSD